MPSELRRIMIQAATMAGFSPLHADSCTIRFGDVELPLLLLEDRFSELVDALVLHGINARLAERAGQIADVFEEAYAKAAEIAGLSLVNLEG